MWQFIVVQFFLTPSCLLKNKSLSIFSSSSVFFFFSTALPTAHQIDQSSLYSNGQQSTEVFLLPLLHCSLIIYNNIKMTFKTKNKKIKSKRKIFYLYGYRKISLLFEQKKIPFFFCLKISKNLNNIYLNANFYPPQICTTPSTISPRVCPTKFFVIYYASNYHCHQPSFHPSLFSYPLLLLDKNCLLFRWCLSCCCLCW